MECLSTLSALVLDDLQGVETDGLRERTALAWWLAIHVPFQSIHTSHNDVTSLNTESRRYVDREVLVTSFITIVLAHVVQVLSADDHCASHLSRDHFSAQQTATNGYKAGPGAFLV